MPTKRQLQAAATRQKIIDESQRLIGEKGFLNVTVDDIASACGIAKGTLYNYFSSKEDIFIYIERGHFQEIRKMVDTMELNNVFDKLKYFLLTWFECVANDNLNLSKDWHRLAVDLKVPTKDNRTHLDEDIQNVMHYLQEGVKNGELSLETPISSIAMDIVFSMYGASFYRCSSYTEFDLIEWSKDFVKYIIDTHLILYKQNSK